MPLYRDEAVVLRTWKLGEADRIVSLHTLGHGKVRAVAKGVRRTRSKFGARLEPACHVSVQLYEGRSELQTLAQAVTIDRFVGLRSDPARFAQASAMLEAVEQLASEAESDPQRHVMLVRALGTLESLQSGLIVAGFFLKLLMLEGVQPELHSCVACGADGPFEALDVAAGGVLCRRCRQGRSISQDALELLRQILGGQLGTALRRSEDDAAGEVTELATAAIEAHLERRLRSMAVLERS
ncbi:MAG: DNA repair protein RecO [Acidimicrobiaceae bacterium]|nr:DNA repair protein RecO [Acidimicrobiaceae bacterium]